MIVFLGAPILALLVAQATGGSILRLESVRLRHAWALPVGLVVLAALPTAPLNLGHGTLLLIWLGVSISSVLVCAANRSTPWLWIVALGLLANMLVVVANGGMPVMTGNLPVAVRDNADLALEGSWLHTLASPSTKLLPLADVIPLSLWGRSGGIASLGDLLLAIGASATLYSLAQDGGGRG